MNRTTEISVDQKFVQSVEQLDKNDKQRVWEAIRKYVQAPNMHGLNLEQLNGNVGKKRLCTFRASNELRVLLAREGHDDHSVGNTRARDAFTDQLGDLATERRPDGQYARVSTDVCGVWK